MANVRILARNLCDFGIITGSPAMASFLPVTNLQRQTERGSPARSGGLSAQDFKLMWTSAQKANMVAFTRHNWSTASTLRTQIYSDQAWTTAVYDGTALAAFSSSGLATDIDYDVVRDKDFLPFKSTAQYFPSVASMQSAKMTLADAANPDGWFDQNRLFVGQYFEFTYNPAYGTVQLQPTDSGKQGRADDGTMVVDKGWKARRLTIDLDRILDADLPTFLAIARYLGRDRECFVSLYPGAGGALEIYNQMACRLVESPTFTPLAPGLHKNTMVFEET